MQRTFCLLLLAVALWNTSGEFKTANELDKTELYQCFINCPLVSA